MNEFTIDVNNGARILKIKEGTTLLRALFSNKIFVSSACGGKAVCGLCRIQILQGGRDLLPQEKPFFTEDEINNGFRLACQTIVSNDMKIMVPDKALNKGHFKTRITSITQLTYDTKGFELALPENEKISFKAGQYVQVVTKPNNIAESVTRAYSIASSPSQKNKLELIVRKVPGGVCTTYMHNNLNVGDELAINGPYGDFFLNEADQELIFIAGGSGLSPLKSIVLDVIEKKLDKKMTFFFGSVTRKDLYYTEFFEYLEKQYPFFRFVPALSKPDPEDAWTGEIGLITEVVDRYIKYTENKGAYLCGSPRMINACLQVLKDKGFTDDKIHFDKF